MLAARRYQSQVASETFLHKIITWHHPAALQPRTALPRPPTTTDATAPSGEPPWAASRCRVSATRVAPTGAADVTISPANHALRKASGRATPT